MDPAESVSRARLLRARGESSTALEILDATLTAHSDSIAALLLKAEILTELRRGAEALETARCACALAPRSSEALNGLARCLHAAGEDRGALRQAEAARQRLAEGDNARHAPAVYLTLVWCLRELRLYREALAAAEEGLGKCPDAVLAHWASVVEAELELAQRERC